MRSKGTPAYKIPFFLKIEGFLTKELLFSKSMVNTHAVFVTVVQSGAHTTVCFLTKVSALDLMHILAMHKY